MTKIVTMSVTHNMTCLVFMILLSPALSSFQDNEVTSTNEDPIIGVLAQEISPKQPDFKNYSSFVVASYVKFLESAGARVVPIWINQSRSYYEDIMSHINGVLFPGGGVDFDNKAGYGDAGAHIYSIAKDLNAKGDYFPLWGTCMGFELLAYLGANRTCPLTTCSAENMNLNLNFLTDRNTSRLFGSAPRHIIDILSTEPVTANFHSFCLTLENVTRYMGDIHWRVISLSEDSNGLTFVSTMESRDMPAYGVQFHPEKSQFEWAPQQKTMHSSKAIEIAQYFANFFVNEARKSSHSFPSREEEKKSLIYQFPVTYTGVFDHYSNEQRYYFK